MVRPHSGKGEVGAIFFKKTHGLLRTRPHKLRYHCNYRGVVVKFYWTIPFKLSARFLWLVKILYFFLGQSHSNFGRDLASETCEKKVALLNSYQIFIFLKLANAKLNLVVQRNLAVRPQWPYRELNGNFFKKSYSIALQLLWGFSLDFSIQKVTEKISQQSPYNSNGTPFYGVFGVGLNQVVTFVSTNFLTELWLFLAVVPQRANGGDHGKFWKIRGERHHRLVGVITPL